MTSDVGGTWTGQAAPEIFPPNNNHVRGPFDHGMIDLAQIIGFARRNFVRISVVTIVLTAIFFILFSLYPFPYRSTALVLVDPRERKVTLTENVLPGIGTDAAILESVVQIVRSDGFLEPVLKKLEVRSDPMFAEAVSADEEDRRKLLEAFKKKLWVTRVGATFIVEISFTSNDPDKSAYYANAVARAFVDKQTQSHVSANEFAAASLQERLQALQNNLVSSEDAVANFKAERGIFDVTRDSTLLQRELIELNQQIAAANGAAEAARARYEQFQNGFGTGEAAEQSDAAQFTELRRQRGQALQNLSEFDRIYGPRHPRVTAERSKLSGIERQIVDERGRLLAIRKEQLESAVAAQKALEEDLQTLKKEASKTDRAMVQLGSLQREADANRRLYEEFLIRFKSTEEQSGIEVEQVQIASAASPPLYTTRPSLVVAVIVFFLLSGTFAVLYAVLREMNLSGRRDRRNGVSTNKAKTMNDESDKKSASEPKQEAPTPSKKQSQRAVGNQDVERTVPSAESKRLPISLGNSHKNETWSKDPACIARSILAGPMRQDLKTVLRPGATVVIGSPRTCPEKFDIALGLAMISGLRSVPALLLDADENYSKEDPRKEDRLSKFEELPISIINPIEFAKNEFEDQMSIWKAVGDFGLSPTGQRSCLIVDAPALACEKGLEQIAKISDYLVLIDYAHMSKSKSVTKLVHDAGKFFPDRFRLILV
ncbi:MAG: GumC family protein [Roseibium sp.]|uniref:GumC family protein n=1 Tax=Roseibium sp. TaxID=1936156 RepID=UPI00261BDA88|nr:GumC family protein [Roseibium sp.]MCV0423965.1 GumC family protein [Roseibium sp.]